MATSKKMTKAQMFAQIKAHLTDEKEIAFIDHELELLAKKNQSGSGDRKPTAAMLENASLRDTIQQTLTSEPQTIEDIKARNAALEKLSVHKMSSLLGQLVTEGKAQRMVIKRKTHYLLPEIEVEG